MKGELLSNTTTSSHEAPQYGEMSVVSSSVPFQLLVLAHSATSMPSTSGTEPSARPKGLSVKKWLLSGKSPGVVTQGNNVERTKNIELH